MEDDLRDHAVAPLTAQQQADLVPGARLVEGGPAHGDEGGIPVPLERVEPRGRHGVAAAVIGAQRGAGGVLAFACRVGTHGVGSRAVPVAASIQVIRAGSGVRWSISPRRGTMAGVGDHADGLARHLAGQQRMAAHRFDDAHAERDAVGA